MHVAVGDESNAEKDDDKDGISLFAKVEVEDGAFDSLRMLGRHDGDDGRGVVLSAGMINAFCSPPCSHATTWRNREYK